MDLQGSLHLLNGLIPKADFEQDRRFVGKLASALEQYGFAGQGMTEYLQRVTRALNLNAEFIVTPKFVLTILWSSDEAEQTFNLFRGFGSGFDLAKLGEVGKLVDRVESGEVQSGDGLECLNAIERMPPEYPAAFNWVAYFLCGSSFALMLGASWLNALFGGLLSVVAYAVVRIASRHSQTRMAKEMIAAFVVAALAGLIKGLLPAVDPLVISLCGVIRLLAGFELTVAQSELIAGNVISGLSWLSGAAIILLQLFGGTAIAFAIIDTWIPLWRSEFFSDTSFIRSWMFSLSFVTGLAVVFRARKKDLPWIWLSALLVWAGLQFGKSWGYWQGSFLGAATLSILSNFFNRTWRLPAATTLLPVAMIMVPGAAALRAIYAIESQGLIAGLQLAYQVLIIIFSILGGFLVGSLIFGVTSNGLPKKVASGQNRNAANRD